MSSHQREFTLRLPLTEALDACRRAVTGPGWRITAQAETGLSCLETPQSAFSFANPVQVEIRLASQPDGSSRVLLLGSNAGFGPIQGNHVKKQVERLVGEIARAATQPAPANSGPQEGALRNVTINGVRLGDDQVRALEQTYRVPIQDGAYWYDPVCGAWGFQGGPVVGFVQAGLNLGGPLRADASNGNTGVFINGRHLPVQDVLGLQRFGPVLPGRYWIDAQGNFGYEGGPPLGNLWVLARAAGGAAGGPWTVHTSAGTVGGDGRGYTFFQMPGGDSWSSG